MLCLGKLMERKAKGEVESEANGHAGSGNKEFS